MCNYALWIYQCFILAAFVICYFVISRFRDFVFTFFRYYDITLLRYYVKSQAALIFHFYIFIFFHFLQFLHQEAAAVDDLNNSYAGARGEEIAIGEGTDFMNTTIHTDLHLASC